jgi:hypothetical protein
MRATLLLCLLGLLGACGSSIPPRPTASVASPPHSEAASSPTVNASPADEFASLARALRLPALATGEACPRSSGRQISKAFGPAFGDGPVYPVFGSDENVIRPSTIDGGYRAKVLWVSDATYQGPVLIRGAQIDGAGVITFTAEGSPSTSDLSPDPPKLWPTASVDGLCSRVSDRRTSQRRWCGSWCRRPAQQRTISGTPMRLQAGCRQPPERRRTVRPVRPGAGSPEGARARWTSRSPTASERADAA